MVLDTQSWNKARGKNPATTKVMRWTTQKLADFVRTVPILVEEKFYNAHIETNGAVASVYFDFDFLPDGRGGNCGSESWQMVRNEDDWKISSM